MIPLKHRVLHAALARSIPEGRRRLWSVTRCCLAKDFTVPHPAGDGRTVLRPAGWYTQLWRATLAKAHTRFGDLVMHDAPDELNTHLDFMLHAHGRVLITGLGLGCVARGCLANPAVRSVTIIERDPDVLWLVAPFMPHGRRCRIIHAEAVAWCGSTTDHFDCAWHDLWSDPDLEEPHLQLQHSKLLCAMARRTALQGAWAMPRDQRRLFRRLLPML